MRRELLDLVIALLYRAWDWILRGSDEYPTTTRVPRKLATWHVNLSKGEQLIQYAFPPIKSTSLVRSKMFHVPSANLHLVAGTISIRV